MVLRFAPSLLLAAASLTMTDVAQSNDLVAEYGAAGEDSQVTEHDARRILPRLSSGFGDRRHPLNGETRLHTGIDIPAPQGSPVRAAASGYVRRAASAGGYGLMVEIDHGDALRTRYAHLSRMLVQAGEWVRAGDVIALVGSTGNSTGNHLHFEVRRDGKALDPIPFLTTPVAVIEAKIKPAPLVETKPHISDFARARSARQIAEEGSQ